VRPALKPGLLPVWRDRDTVQIGIDSRRAVALTGMAGVAWVIGLLDGSRDRAQVIEAAGDRGIPGPAVERVLALLASAGALDDFPAGTLRLLSAPARARLAAELATASLAHGDGDGGARTLARRLATNVRVHGDGKVGASLADLLAAAGVGQVRQAGPPPGPASRGTRAPRPARRDRPAPAPARPDLAILIGRYPQELQADLMRGQIPHLAVSAGEAIGMVGPLVRPGRSACLRCLDLARADRDPAWPLILAQLTGREPDPPACDAPLAAAVAAQAAFQALAFIDRAGPAAAVTNGTLELVLPGWQWRRRTWPPHPRCSCGAPGARA
jgi:bacteriocin biosynthesis cyclodehydratase domain-containing protein